MSTFVSATASAGRSSTAGILTHLFGRNADTLDRAAYVDMRDVFIAGISPSEAQRMTG